jgi:DNA-binding XRE family transcriptional regulator
MVKHGAQMADVKYKPIPHDHEAFLKKALKRKGFRKAYEDLKEEHTLTCEMLDARSRFGLTQETVAELMGTTKSAVSRLEAAGKHAPSLTTLKKYAQAVGCRRVHGKVARRWNGKLVPSVWSRLKV